jgi:hypothetical protein
MNTEYYVLLHPERDASTAQSEIPCRSDYLITPFQGLVYAVAGIHRVSLCAVDARALPLCGGAISRPVNPVETHAVRLLNAKHNHAVLRRDAKFCVSTMEETHAVRLYTVATNNHTNQINHAKITVQTISKIINH